MVGRIPFAAVCILLVTISLSAQDGTFYVFPQIADGRSLDGTSFQSTLMIMPFTPDKVTCNFVLYGLTAKFDAGGNGSNLDITIPVNSSFFARTTMTQNLRNGYATLTCSHPVMAQVLYTFSAPDGSKMGEATIFPSFPWSLSEIFLDARDGARLGVAIANDTDLERTYNLTLRTPSGGTYTGSVKVPARRNIARFVDEMMSLPKNAIGILLIESADGSGFSTTGVRFTGAVFTTMPAF